jgi:hypothetical protein
MYCWSEAGMLCFDRQGILLSVPDFFDQLLEHFNQTRESRQILFARILDRGCPRLMV